MCSSDLIGARVRVQVSRVDLDGRKIDFRWVQDDLSEAATSLARKKKAAVAVETFNVQDRAINRHKPKKTSAPKSGESTKLHKIVKLTASRASKSLRRTKKSLK